MQTPPRPRFPSADSTGGRFRLRSRLPDAPQRFALAAMIGILAGSPGALAQTEGTARMAVTINDYNGSGARHYTVAWVTTESGAFVKSLRKQGPSSWTSKQWTDHCQTWNTARAGSTVLDGYTSATATSYTGTNSPVVCTWNGLDAANQPVPDGRYKFWVQYAEDSGQGPFTTGGLLWSKGTAAATNSYPNQGANFTDMRVTWIPSAPPTFPPAITSATPPGNATVGVPYSHACTATGTSPVTFTAQGLPAGLDLAPSGVISGTPTAPGTVTGRIVAANGTAPDATQTFTIVVGVVPTTIRSATITGGNLVLAGTGPAYGRYTVLTSADANPATAQWSVLAGGTFDAAGHFGFTHAIDPSQPRRYYTVRVP